MTMSQFDLLSAAAAGGAEPPAWLTFMPLVAMVFIFWFLILRPQMRQQKAHREKLGGLRKGDQVITGGGLVGKVVRVDDNYVDVELAPSVKVRAVKSTISEVLSPTAAAPAND